MKNNKKYKTTTVGTQENGTHLIIQNIRCKQKLEKQAVYPNSKSSELRGTIANMNKIISRHFN